VKSWNKEKRNNKFRSLSLNICWPEMLRCIKQWSNRGKQKDDNKHLSGSEITNGWSCRCPLCGVYPFEDQWLLYLVQHLTFTNFTFCPWSVCTCFVWASEYTMICNFHSIYYSVFYIRGVVCLLSRMVWIFKYQLS
jgi:hypothetical protein